MPRQILETLRRVVSPALYFYSGLLLTPSTNTTSLADRIRILALRYQAGCLSSPMIYPDLDRPKPILQIGPLRRGLHVHTLQQVMESLPALGGETLSLWLDSEFCCKIFKVIDHDIEIGIGLLRWISVFSKLPA